MTHMPKKKETPFNNPFAQLKIGTKQQRSAPLSAPSRPLRKPVPPEDESALFLETVGQVVPVSSAGQRLAPSPAAEPRMPNEDAEGLTRLAELVASGHEFETAGSDDFLEGAIRGFDRNVMRKLKGGAFASAAQVDLHGMTRAEAKAAVESFIQKSRMEGHRCVLVITGKGLHSQEGPALRDGLEQWLTRGRAAKQILGFCSAQPRDGGTGAVYVLLRR